MIPAPYLEIAVVALGLLVLLVEAFAEKIEKRTLALAGAAGLVAILAATFFLQAAPAATATGFWSFYSADALAIFFKRFALVTTVLVLLLMIDYAPTVRQSIHGATRQSGLGEFFALPLFTCAGLMWMASAVDFVMIFVSLELVTMSFYVLVAFTRRNPLTLEAGVKYLILSALSTGFLVYGITWIFGVTGETNLSRIAAVFQTGAVEQVPALFGIALVLVALGFKIAAVPFQIWVPDVYQGAPTPVTAFLSVGSKAAGFVVLMRVLEPFFVLPQIGRLLAVLAGATLLYGNLAAIPQTNLKRLLAYSSIAHAGYLLIGVVSFAGQAVAFYLVSYLLMTILSFAVLIVVAQHAGGDRLEDFNGLSRRSPFLAFALLLAMASLAGVPFTAGFLGKFFIFDAAVRHGHTVLITIGILTVACGFYYYFKVVRAMYWETGTATETDTVPVSGLTRTMIIGLMAGIIILGVYPQPILNALRSQPTPAVVPTGR